MRVQSMPDTCTGRHFYAFQHDLTKDSGYSEEQIKEFHNQQKKEIQYQLDAAKQARIVCVFAFLIGPQTQSKAQLEEFGFTEVVNYHNYKYPDTSKRLIMMARDMNDWEVKKVEAVVNPFAATPTPAAPVAAPQPIPAPVRGPMHRIQSVEYSQEWLTTRGHDATTRERPELGGVIRRYSRRYTEAGNLEGFPIGRWVEIPAHVTEVPPSLVGHNVEVLLVSGGFGRGPGVEIASRPAQSWFWGQHAAGRITHVRRID